MKGLISYSLNHPRTICRFLATISALMILLVALPSIWPQTFSPLQPVRVDTDPENMLNEQDPARVFHNEMKREFGLYDMVVVGVINETDPQGVFTPASLARIHELAEYAATLRWEDPDHPGEMAGVVPQEMISPGNVDNIEQAGPGTVDFEWLMATPATSPEAAREVRERAARIPFLDGTLISNDGKALALYIPITSKDVSYKVANKLRERIDSFSGDDNYHITGLPVSEDTFGVEMFIQMAICAPAAMLLIFFIMLWFFKRVALVLAAMAVAMVSVILAMGLLIATGHTLHIMSSMIPIFIMPIAVLDSIHILSEFFDRHETGIDRRKTIESVIGTLYKPMLFTSLTTAAGFASLALTPIPPLQVFGLFVAFGVMVAWLVTMTLVPATIMLLHPKRLEHFGLRHAQSTACALPGRPSLLANWAACFTYHRAGSVIMISMLLCATGVYGINKIIINDNPVKWFAPGHEIRIADREMNRHFGGTYMAYLTLSASDKTTDDKSYFDGFMQRLQKHVKHQADINPTLITAANEIGLRLQQPTSSRQERLNALLSFCEDRSMSAPDRDYAAWDSLADFIGDEMQRGDIFKQPEALKYIQALQAHLNRQQVVGKSNSIADLVSTVHRELREGADDQFRIPDSASAVAQTLITFQNSHRPDDLWHFITPDYRRASIWLQLRSGDNQDMTEVVAEVDRYMAANPPPFDLRREWFGLTYINVVWQEQMVTGMVSALLGGGLTVFAMTVLLFRSVYWGFLCMVPLTITIVFMYGVIGLIGKDYDMPIAVLSALSLGLAVDYAIHFVTRARAMQARLGSWNETIRHMFQEPARAISRNAIVNGAGFTPLLFAPLVPYQTVGIFIAAILTLSGIATLLILPALISLLRRRLFASDVIEIAVPDSPG